jgi:hypothetical protein
MWRKRKISDSTSIRGIGAFLYLLQRNPVVLKEQEAIIANGDLDLLNKFINYSRVIRIQQGKINRAKFSEILLLLSDWRRNPCRDKRLAREVGRRRVERG